LKATPFAFSSRYRKVHLNSEIPIFYVSFLGCCEIDDQNEVSKAAYRTQLISVICERLRLQKRKPRRVELSISWHGIEITELRRGSKELIPIFLINRGMTDVERPRIFAFLSQNATTRRMECFAFGTNTAKTSWAMTLAMKRSFEVAYDTWKSEQKKRIKLHDEKLLNLAEELRNNRDDSSCFTRSNRGNEELQNSDGEIGYSPRVVWTQFEEDLMEKSSKRLFTKAQVSHRRIPSVREVVAQPAVDSVFRERLQVLVSRADVFDVGDNEGLRKAAEDEEVQVLSLKGMDKNSSQKESCDDDLLLFQ